ncbi:MAG: FG-GAP repeat protein, partial [Xanthomonadales bacterium]|nr:FG-GAP repeat protein [Xanthomonadales bacterium]
MNKQNSRFIRSLTAILALMMAISATATTGAPTREETPKGLWQAFHDARHAIEAVENDQPEKTFRASNYGNGFSMQFNSRGMTLKERRQDSPWQLTMRLVAYGQPHSIQPVQQATLQTDGRRVTYHRGNISEWYVNRNDGLEQGFTLNDKPENYQADQPVQVNLSLDGNVQPHWVDEGQTLGFYDGDQRKVFNYSKLIAHDATGQNLPATMQLADGQIILEVDTADAAWPVTIDPLFSTETKVTGVDSDATAGDDFGFSVALDGDTALIGSYLDDSFGMTNDGSAYVFVRTQTSWNLQGKLLPSPTVTGSSFGVSVALDGDTALIGAHFGGAGSAYVFTRTASTWSQQQKLTGADSVSGDNFGWSVALADDLALIGAWRDDGDVGSAYVFFRNTGAVNCAETGTPDPWCQEAKLLAADGVSNNRFGVSVALSGIRALVGAHEFDANVSPYNVGAAYVFEQNLAAANCVETGTPDPWCQEAKLTAADAAEWDGFGRSVALDGDTALIGAYKNDTGSGPVVADSGSAYVFVRNVAVVNCVETGSPDPWCQQANLVADDAGAVDYFGTLVALQGDTA